MSLPDFLVIGAQRSGSTWLHELLQSHPSIFMPQRRKEVQYFNKYYDRGLDWYRGFFPDGKQAGVYGAIGEATPTYLYKSGVPERISSALPDVKLLLILRNPADRAFSQFVMLSQNDDYRRSFEELLEENRGIFDYGLYGAHLSKFLRYFDRSRFCVLVYEHAVEHVEETKERVARFLDIVPERFPLQAGQRRVGGSYVPKARRAFALAKRAARWMQANDLDWPVNIGKRSVKGFLGARERRPAFADETRSQLLVRYQDDIDLLAKQFDLDLSAWRPPEATASSDRGLERASLRLPEAAKS